MREDKDKKRKEDLSEKAEDAAEKKKNETPEYAEPKKAEDEQITLLREINATLNSDLEFYKKQFQTVTDKLKAATEAVMAAQESERKLKEMQLDYDNLKKRSAASIETAEEEGIIKAVKVLLPVADNFRRAITAISDPNVVDGLKMIYKQIMEAFSKLDVEEIPALGLQFDPEIHSAVMQVEAEDKESGTVVEVLTKGYIKGDKVIRYTEVKIAR